MQLSSLNKCIFIEGMLSIGFSFKIRFLMLKLMVKSHRNNFKIVPQEHVFSKVNDYQRTIVFAA